MPLRDRLYDWRYAFPVQLLLLHLRQHLALLALWAFLAAMILGYIGPLFGIAYLFLTPEYLSTVNALGFLLLGLCFGAFWMSWNLSTYVLSARYFPFLATMRRPFLRFCVNNALVPGTVLLLFLVELCRYQYVEENWPIGQIAGHLAGFLAGLWLTYALFMLYFGLTNKDLSSFIKSQHLPPNLIRQLVPGRAALLQLRRAERPVQALPPVRLYLARGLRWQRVRSVAHYDPAALRRVFRQNHANALVVQMFSILLISLLGLLMDFPLFRIPAAASACILLAILTNLAGALIYWLRRWHTLALLGLLALLNAISQQGYLKYDNQAYGLDYGGQAADYGYANIQRLHGPDSVRQDSLRGIATLEAWRAAQGEEKPKMVLLCTSGGGIRAATWTTHVLQQADAALQGRLWSRTALVTGASGGMFGAAYFRELKRQGAAQDPYDSRHIGRIAADLLNPLMFAFVSTDVFLPFGRFEQSGRVYKKDRAYLFEKQFNENTQGLLQRPVGSYAADEAAARVPMLLLAPTVLNDGRRLLIGAQSHAYLCAPPLGIRQRPDIVEYDAVECRRLFAAQGADSLSLVTALRLNATYPYILPTVHLPSRPRIEVFDSGFRDNYGVVLAARFAQYFAEWIKANTSGVLLLRVVGWDKIEPVASSEGQGIVEGWFNPLGIVGQMMSLQDFEHDNSLDALYRSLGPEMLDVVEFTYQPSDAHRRASMNFHLTDSERQDVLRAFSQPANQRSLQRLRAALDR